MLAANPRNAREAMTPIEYVRRRLASTMSGLRMFGRISPKRMLNRGIPRASAAATKSRSTTGWDAPRVTRATRGIVVSPTAPTMSQADGPSIEIATSTSMIWGKARITSMSRMITSSQSPLEYAASIPRVVPSTSPSAVANVARSRISAPPSRNRLHTSWPM